MLKNRYGFIVIILLILAPVRLLMELFFQQANMDELKWNKDCFNS